MGKTEAAEEMLETSQALESGGTSKPTSILSWHSGSGVKIKPLFPKLGPGVGF